MAVLILFGASTNAWAEGGTQRVLVKFAPGQGRAVKAAATQAGGVVHHDFQHWNTISISVPAAAVAQLKKNPNVVHVQKDAEKRLSQERVPYGVTMVKRWRRGRQAQTDPASLCASSTRVSTRRTKTFNP